MKKSERLARQEQRRLEIELSRVVNVMLENGDKPEKCIKQLIKKGFEEEVVERVVEKVSIKRKKQIRDEAMKLYDMGYIETRDDLPASSFYKDNRWKSFYLKVYKNKIPSAYEYAPNTMALIDQVPSMNIALFAMLMPGKAINQHHDPFSYTVRYSLGLSTPNSNECGIVVDRHDYKWKDGDSIIFDENYMHDAYNRTEKPRLILMTDIDRPMTFNPVQKVYYYFGFWFNRAFGIDNFDSQHTGIGNKLGGWVVGYRAFMKKMKQANRTLYVIVKNVLFFSLLAWLIWAILT